MHAANRAAMLRLARLQPGAAARADAHAAPGLRAAAAATLVLLRGERELAHARAGLKLLAELGVGLRAARRRAGAPRRAGPEPADRAARGDPPAAGRRRQLPPVRAAAEDRGAAPRRATSASSSRRRSASSPGSAPGRSPPARPRATRFDARRAVQRRRRRRRCCAPLAAAAAAGRRSTATRSPRRCGMSRATRTLGPRSALMDETLASVAITRLGQRVRVAGSAEVGGSGRPTSTSARCARCTACSTTGFPAPSPPRRRSAGKARGRCCPTARRCSAPAARRASGSTWATAPAAGRWPAARRGCSPSRSPAARRRWTPSSDQRALIGRSGTSRQRRRLRSSTARRDGATVARMRPSVPDHAGVTHGIGAARGHCTTPSSASRAGRSRAALAPAAGRRTPLMRARRR
ncbi:MAG: hypothetical protein MZW92_18975 [Comamonadaceae bacterium]|nr:hypothetical protein [Comamonadaceae bacterium]